MNLNEQRQFKAQSPNLCELFTTLKLSHGRRRRSPYRFCCSYEALETELLGAWRRASAESERAELQRIEAYMSEIAADYNDLRHAAKEQENRNRPWFRGGKRRPVVSGGRADGNGG